MYRVGDDFTDEITIRLLGPHLLPANLERIISPTPLEKGRQFEFERYMGQEELLNARAKLDDFETNGGLTEEELVIYLAKYIGETWGNIFFCDSRL